MPFSGIFSLTIYSIHNHVQQLTITWKVSDLYMCGFLSYLISKYISHPVFFFTSSACERKIEFLVLLFIVNNFTFNYSLYILLRFYPARGIFQIIHFLHRIIKFLKCIRTVKIPMYKIQFLLYCYHISPRCADRKKNIYSKCTQFYTFKHSFVNNDREFYKDHETI